MKKAFTMIELIFVIVIIGILASVALPRMSATRDDAIIARDVSYIASAMTEVSTFTITKGDVKDDLTEMSPTLKALTEQNKAVVGVKSVTLQDCIIISVENNNTMEILRTVSIPSVDRICKMVQNIIQDKDYPIILHGQVIKF